MNGKEQKLYDDLINAITKIDPDSWHHATVGIDLEACAEFDAEMTRIKTENANSLAAKLLGGVINNEPPATE